MAYKITPTHFCTNCYYENVAYMKKKVARWDFFSAFGTCSGGTFKIP